jgi:hypothetical protein
MRQVVNALSSRYVLGRKRGYLGRVLGFKKSKLLNATNFNRWRQNQSDRILDRSHLVQARQAANLKCPQIDQGN